MASFIALHTLEEGPYGFSFVFSFIKPFPVGCSPGT